MRGLNLTAQLRLLAKLSSANMAVVRAPAPGHLPARETFVFGDDDRPQVGGPDVAARHKAENEDLVAQL